MGTVGLSEIRVSIRPVEAPESQPEPIPAQLFKKTFDAFWAAVVAADRELHAKTASSQFLVSRLAEAPCEFGIVERQKAPGVASSAIELFRRCAGGVYRSDYQILLRRPRLMRAFDRIANALDAAYAVLLQFHDMELPLDAFFSLQVGRVGRLNSAPAKADVWFAGTAITSFEGRLESIDYRGPVWRGRLTLAGGETQIECLFDKSKGEEAVNPFGNKSVSVTGRAIYTGDSQLPERVEVLKIEETIRAPAAIGIEGTLAPALAREWESGLDYVD
jgi:hypothetical protein